MVAARRECYDPPLLASLHSSSDGLPAADADPAAPGTWRLASWGLLSSVTTAALTWILQLAVARFMAPAPYAEALVLLAVFMVLAAPLIPILLVVTTRVVDLRREGREGDAGALLGRLSVGTLAAGLAFVACVVLGQEGLATLLNVSEPGALPLLATALVANALFLIGHAVLLGELRWAAASSLPVALAATRLAFSLLFLAAGFGIQGVFLGLAASTVCVAALAQLLARRPLPRGGRYPGLPLRHVALAVVLTAAFWFLVHVDLLYVNRLLPQLVSQGYGAASTLGRMLVLVPFSVLHLMFPFLAGARNGADRRRVLARMTATALALGATGVLGLTLAPALVLALTYPPEYASAAPLLLPVSAMLAPYGVMAVLLYAALANNDRPAAVLFGVAAAAVSLLLAVLPPSLTTLAATLGSTAGIVLAAGALRASRLHASLGAT
jgi:O-antigen/teichoic acid export membrane protein